MPHYPNVSAQTQTWCFACLMCGCLWGRHPRGDEVADWHDDLQWLAGSIHLALMPNYKDSGHSVVHNEHSPLTRVQQWLMARTDLTEKQVYCA